MINKQKYKLTLFGGMFRSMCNQRSHCVFSSWKIHKWEDIWEHYIQWYHVIHSVEHRFIVLFLGFFIFPKGSAKIWEIGKIGKLQIWKKTLSENLILWFQIAKKNTSNIYDLELWSNAKINKPNFLQHF